MNILSAMKKKYKIILLACSGIWFVPSMNGQRTDANVFGDVRSALNGEHIPFANVFIEGTTTGTTTDETGHYMLIDLPEGKHILVAQSVGYMTARDTVTVVHGHTRELNFLLKEEMINLNAVVVTGTKTFKRQTESAVIVNVMEGKSLNMIQACNIAEGLRFQPGLRVETDCQTCNYTQLRMNGLGGGYSQILINGRPVFSPLTGLYGMEQIPANMIERIEVVRGGGSALYGSSAIGGTVNIITRIPQQESFDFSTDYMHINAKANDLIINGNATVLNKKRNAGTSVFVNRRSREAYDHNGDGFSELPRLNNNSFGANLFFRPDQNQKLEVNLASLNEFRYGGEMTGKAAHLALQSEERTHRVLMGGLDYQINFNGDKSSFIVYAAGQYTGRSHYTGIFPDSAGSIAQHLANPPYGNTENYTWQAGTQINQRFDKILGTSGVITAGMEYILDDVLDSIPAYRYVTDQRTGNVGVFLQSDWELTKNLNLLAGLRIDKHNFVDHMIASPRLSLLYKIGTTTQARVTWGTGFRAPQAFDTDLHIAFAGGGVSRVTLAPGLSEERSHSLSGSLNYDKAAEKFIAGFTIEGFYTRLDQAFVLTPEGTDEYGTLYMKRNGQGAEVAGSTIEIRANYNRKVQLEAGFTWQRSLFDKPVENIVGEEPVREFLRTPDTYGFATLLLTPGKWLNASVSAVYTGPMRLAHFAGAPEQAFDAYRIVPAFTELNLKVAYAFMLKALDTALEISAGVKNLTQSYQDDFDTGKNRDSGYVYGPAAPRTVFAGIRFRSL